MTTTASRPILSARQQAALLFATGVLAACSALGTALSPYLLVEKPLLLLALNPAGRHLVLVSASVEPWHAVIVSAVRRGLALSAMFGLAYVYGRSALDWVGQRKPWVERALDRLEQAYAKVGVWLVVFAPFVLVAAFAGLARMRWWVFLLAIAPGQFAVVYAVLEFGDSVSQWTAPILAFAAQYPLQCTSVFVAFVVVQQLVSRRRRLASSPRAPRPRSTR